MLRRTKKNFPNLFKKNNVEVEHVKIKMLEDQRNCYQNVENQLTKTFKEMVEKGELRGNMMHIFAIVSKLRQICDHK